MLHLSCRLRLIVHLCLLRHNHDGLPRKIPIGSFWANLWNSEHLHSDPILDNHILKVPITPAPPKNAVHSYGFGFGKASSGSTFGGSAGRGRDGGRCSE
jgi:hypothetical protein